jgi:hypothetical protein
MIFEPLMRPAFLLALGALAISACASERPASRWYHPTKTQEAYARDNYECTREVKLLTKDDWVIGPVWWVMAEKNRMEKHAKELYANCMAARGYFRQEGETAPAPPPTARDSVGLSPSRPAATSPAAGLTGTFTGTVTGEAQGRPFSMQVTLTLVQDGVQVVGVWNTTGGTAGTVSGTVAGTKFAFRAKQVNPCEGNFTGSAAFEGNVNLRGTYSGGDCAGSIAATFGASRQ